MTILITTLRASFPTARRGTPAPYTFQEARPDWPGKGGSPETPLVKTGKCPPEDWTGLSRRGTVRATGPKTVVQGSLSQQESFLLTSGNRHSERCLRGLSEETSDMAPEPGRGDQDQTNGRTTIPPPPHHCRRHRHHQRRYAQHSRGGRS